MQITSHPDPEQPKRRTRGAARPAGRHGVLFAVYAPFGTDPLLSSFPDGQQQPIAQQPLLQHLRAVAAQGADVAALIDLADDDSWLVEIPAWCPDEASIVSAWKQAMSRPQALAGFLRRAHQRFPCNALVLALEGHGAGFLPEVDAGRITPASTSRSDGTRVQWHIGDEASEPVDLSTGLPPLPVGAYQELPVDSPEALPLTLPISTWALAEALSSAHRAGVPKPAVIHFNNCFNMALEHLHTIAPHAGVATGYANYNFFTAGTYYPKVFERLRQAGSASAEEFAQWFAAANEQMLAAKGNHPTIGATLNLSRMKQLAGAVDRMAAAMTAALRPANPADRPAALARIKTAIAAALQYDTQGDYGLEVPDQATDLGGLAVQLQRQFPAGPVHDAAVAVETALIGVWQYGAFEHPHVDETQTWDFRDNRLGVSILLPDPALEGLWDWRTPYYMAGAVDPAKPPALKAQIPFLADRPGGARAPWPEFLQEYHRDVPFVGLLRIRPPEFPLFDAEFKPKYPPPSDDDGAGAGQCSPKGAA